MDEAEKLLCKKLFEQWCIDTYADVELIKQIIALEQDIVSSVPPWMWAAWKAG